MYLVKQGYYYWSASEGQFVSSQRNATRFAVQPDLTVLTDSTQQSGDDIPRTIKLKTRCADVPAVPAV